MRERRRKTGSNRVEWDWNRERRV